MRIHREESLALVIDLQERLAPAMAEQVALVDNCKKLISGLQELMLPTIVTQQYSKGLGETIDEIKSLIADFSPVEKRSFSCYDELLVAEHLKNSKAKNIIICGIESHVCVLQTAVDLKEAGYNPVVVMDCISSRKLDDIDLAAERFRQEGIIMTSCESILFELTRTSTAPEFKAISKIIK